MEAQYRKKNLMMTWEHKQIFVCIPVEYDFVA